MIEGEDDSGSRSATAISFATTYVPNIMSNLVLNGNRTNQRADLVDHPPGMTDIQIRPVTRAVGYTDCRGIAHSANPQMDSPIQQHRATGSGASD